MGALPNITLMKHYFFQAKIVFSEGESVDKDDDVESVSSDASDSSDDDDDDVMEKRHNPISQLHVSSTPASGFVHQTEVNFNLTDQVDFNLDDRPNFGRLESQPISFSPELQAEPVQVDPPAFSPRY